MIMPGPGNGKKALLAVFLVGLALTRAEQADTCVHVATVRVLEKAVADQTISCIALAPGRYKTTAELRILHDIHIEADDASATLDGAQNGGTVVVSVAANVTAVLVGLTITGGANTVVPYPEDCASGIRNLGTLTMLRCEVVGNAGRDYGGGIASVHGFLNITDCTISHNTALTEGGGLYTEGGMVNITNSVFFGNSARAGGAIASLSVINMENSSVLNNSATGNLLNYEGEGGGIWSTCHMALDPGNVITLTNCTVANNTAALGGGISVFAGAAILHDSIVTGNSASIDPGVRVHQYYHDGKRQTDSTLLIHGNSAIYNNGVNPSFNSQSLN